MKRALAVLPTVALLACSQDLASLPTVPSSTTSSPPNIIANVTLWGMGVDERGVCIPGATFRSWAARALAGVRRRRPLATHGLTTGVVFTEVTPGIEMTLRASAPGYSDERRTVVPRSGSQYAVLFTPSRIE
jgi:hypothetical protein